MYRFLLTPFLHRDQLSVSPGPKKGNRGANLPYINAYYTMVSIGTRSDWVRVDRKSRSGVGGSVGSRSVVWDYSQAGLGGGVEWAGEGTQNSLRIRTLKNKGFEVANPCHRGLNPF